VPTRNLTILFTDIQGFTARTSSSTRADVKSLLEEHERLLSPVFAHFHGTVVKTIGDAFLVTFESPTDAVVCGLAIQEVLRQHNAQVPEGRKLAVRVAINVGEVEVRDGDVFGEPVNLAARLEGITDAGEVFFTEAVYLTMNRQEAPSTSVGEHTFKGIPGTVRVYKVLQDQSSEQLQQLTRTIEVGEGKVHFRALDGATVEPISAAPTLPRGGKRALAGRLMVSGFVAGAIGLGLFVQPILSERLVATRAHTLVQDGDLTGALTLLETNLDKNPDRPSLRKMAVAVAREHAQALEKDEGAQNALTFVNEELEAHRYLDGLKSEVPRLETEATLHAMLMKGGPSYKFFDKVDELVLSKYPKNPEVPYAAAEVMKNRYIVEVRLPRYRMALDRGHPKTEAMYESAVEALARNLPGTSTAEEGLAMLDKAFPDRKAKWAGDALDTTGDALLNAWPLLEAAKDPRLNEPLYQHYRTVMLGKDVASAAGALSALTEPKEAHHAQMVLKDALERPMLGDADRQAMKTALDALTARVGPLPEAQ
jgi:class 3 adenylate cyclase